MLIKQSERGFLFLMHPKYVPPHDEVRLVSESSAVGDYEDSWKIPGSSFLWIGEHHHLNREEVESLITNLRHWLDNKRLPAPKESP